MAYKHIPYSKKVASIGLISVLSLGTVANVYADTSFTDVPTTHWAYSYIQEASENGWVTGKGNNIYDPEGKVTTAEFYTLLARAFYGSEVPSTAQSGQWYSDKWYGPYYEVGLKHDFDNLYLNKVDCVMDIEGSLNRSGMASLITGVLKDKGITISDAEYNNAKAKIPDINTTTEHYQQGIVTVYALGIITGVDNAGNFNAGGFMTRAQVATVLCRLDDVIKNGGSISTPDNGNNEEENNTGTTNPGTSTGANYGPVGTLSDFMVTLSSETHKPVTDYWSKTDPAIQAVTDKDSYNAAVQTLKDEKISRTTGIYDNVGKNPYYNYAVFEGSSNDLQKKVSQAASNINGFGRVQVKYSVTTFGDMFFTLGNPKDFNGYSQYSDVLNSITSGMTDKEVVIKCVKKVTDVFTYGKGVGSWSSDSKVGMCDEFAPATAQILNAAGIPTFTDSGDTKFGYHMWCYALVDGEWMVVDGTWAETLNAMGNDSLTYLWFNTPENYWAENEIPGTPNINTPGTLSSITRSMIEQAGYAPRHNK